MQWHWGNIGSMLAGLSTIVIAVGALIRGPAVIRAWLDGKAADAEEARARAEALRADAEERRLERRRTLLGWSPNGVEAHNVTLVTDAAEAEKAAAEAVKVLTGPPSRYVILRVDEADTNGAVHLALLVEEHGIVCRPPTASEREALERGVETLDVWGAGRPPRESFPGRRGRPDSSGTA